MHSYPQEFVLVCRQLGEAQQRCSAALAAQAAQIEALQAEVVRLRGAVVLRDTRLALAQDALVSARAAEPGLPRRKAMARHIAALAERITTLSRECLRWRLAAEVDAIAVRPSARAQAPVALHADVDVPVSSGAGVSLTPSLYGPGPSNATSEVPSEPPHPGANKGLVESPAHPHMAVGLAVSLAAADLVICQTGCISHDEYWRVQDHCRRTGKPCILVDQPLAARGAHAMAATEPAVILRMTRPRHVDETAAEVVADNFE